MWSELPLELELELPLELELDLELEPPLELPLELQLELLELERRAQLLQRQQSRKETKKLHPLCTKPDSCRTPRASHPRAHNLNSSIEAKSRPWFAWKRHSTTLGFRDRWT